MEVQKARRGTAIVAERVHHVGWDGGEAAGADADPLSLRADREGQLALEHVEGVGVPAMDVGFRSALAGGVARPGHRELRLGGEQDDLAPLLIRDLLAVAQPHAAQC
jgi:hypothetical protein